MPKTMDEILKDVLVETLNDMRNIEISKTLDNLVLDYFRFVLSYETETEKYTDEEIKTLEQGYYKTIFDNVKSCNSQKEIIINYFKSDKTVYQVLIERLDNSEYQMRCTEYGE